MSSRRSHLSPRPSSPPEVPPEPGGARRGGAASGLSRRTLLKGVLAGGALAGAGRLLTQSSVAEASTLTAQLSTAQTYKVLEIFLDGGADLWGHFYKVPSWDQHITRINPGVDTISPAYLTQWNNLFSGATPAWVPSSPGYSTLFNTAGNGDQVHWGAAVKPLIATCMGLARVVVVGHNLAPHEAATPLALNGVSFGRPIASALGAAVNRVRAAGTAPVSFVIPIRDSGIGPYVLQAATATGFHGAVNQPVLIACGNPNIMAQLNRSVPQAGTTVARAAGDPLRNFYNGRFRSMLMKGNARSRSRAYDAYEGSLTTLHDHAGVLARLNDPLLTFALPSSNDAANNPTSTAVRAACRILGAGARHAVVVDSDWDAHDNGIGGTTPEQYALHNTKKIYWVAHAIAEAVTNGTLDLSTTLVYIHTEFGRHHEGSNGGAHHPSGYPVVLIGGPITSSAVVGHANFYLNSPNVPFAVSDGDYGVTAVRAAIALAAGINPWHQDMYVESDDWLGSLLNSSLPTLSNGNIPYLEQDILGV